MAGGVINSGSFPKALWPGIYAWWGLKYNEYNMLYKDLFDMTTSQKSYEEIVEGIGLGPAPRKEQGTSVQYQSMQQGVINRWNNISYALGFIITYEEMMDNLYQELVMDRTARLAFSMRQTREIVGANFYNTAFAGRTYGDGQPIISTAHPSQVGNQSNRLAVDADLSETALEDLCIQIRRVRDNAGLRIALMPTKLIVEPGNEFNACRILKSQLQNDTANNAVNALMQMGYFSGGYSVNPFLTDQDAWFVRTNAPKGMLWFDRMPTEFSEDNDFDTDNMKYKAYMRFVPGFGDWRALWGSSGA